MHSAAGGLHPNSVLPVVLDVGCDDEAVRAGDGYVGRREARLKGPPYDDLVEEFFSACQVCRPVYTAAVRACCVGRLLCDLGFPGLQGLRGGEGYCGCVHRELCRGEDCGRGVRSRCLGLGCHVT